MNNRDTKAALEAELKRRAIPLVAVDEAKKALFTSSKIKSFDFVVYCPDGGNWLVQCASERWPSPAVRADLARWEQVFGDGYRAVIVRMESDGLIVYPLDNAEQKTLADALGDALEAAIDEVPTILGLPIEGADHLPRKSMPILEAATLEGGQRVFDASMAGGGAQLAFTFG